MFLAVHPVSALSPVSSPWQDDHHVEAEVETGVTSDVEELWARLQQSLATRRELQHKLVGAQRTTQLWESNREFVRQLAEGHSGDGEQGMRTPPSARNCVNPSPVMKATRFRRAIVLMCERSAVDHGGCRAPRRNAGAELGAAERARRSALRRGPRRPIGSACLSFAAAIRPPASDDIHCAPQMACTPAHHSGLISLLSVAVPSPPQVSVGDLQQLSSMLCAS